MKILLKSVKIFDNTSKYHLKKMDILIESGIVKEIAKSITPSEAYQVVQEQGVGISPAWMDTNFHIFEPGQEYREDFKSEYFSANG
jgi:dihydroorotase